MSQDRSNFLISLIPLLLTPLQSNYLPMSGKACEGNNRFYDFQKVKTRRKMAKESRRRNRN